MKREIYVVFAWYRGQLQPNTMFSRKRNAERRVRQLFDAGWVAHYAKLPDSTAAIQEYVRNYTEKARGGN